MAVLRDNQGPVARAKIDAVWPDAGQRERCLAALVSEGLAEAVEGCAYALAGSASG